MSPRTANGKAVGGELLGEPSGFNVAAVISFGREQPRRTVDSRYSEVPRSSAKGHCPNLVAFAPDPELPGLYVIGCEGEDFAYSKSAVE